MENKKSFVSRSVYQKLFEENKRLKKDIEILVMEPMDFEVWDKWRKIFHEDRKFKSTLKQVATQYLKDHPEYDITSPHFKRQETKTK